MASQMSDEQWREFLLTGTRTAKVAVTRANGAPHVTPVWFLLDRRDGVDEIVFTTGASSVKGRALRRDPRFSVCVDDENPPYALVSVQAEATLSDDPDEVRRWAARLGGRYMGQDRAEEFGERNAVPGEVLVRGAIQRVTAYLDIAD